VDTTRTSDDQGGRLTSDGFATCYYVAVIGKRPLNVYVKAYTGSFIYNWFPKLILYKVSVDRPGTIAEDGEIIEEDGGN
jgi:hypothetical protein